MIALLAKVLKDCTTENNGTSYCPFRIGGMIFSAMVFPTFTWATIYSVLQTHHFDYMAFGAAVGAIFTSIALLAHGVAAKARTDTP